jgi:hypothetical protein
VTRNDSIIRTLALAIEPLPPPRTKVKFMALPRTPRIQALRADASQTWAERRRSSIEPAPPAACRHAATISRGLKLMSAAAALPARRKSSPAPFHRPARRPVAAIAAIKAAA